MAPRQITSPPLAQQAAKAKKCAACGALKTLSDFRKDATRGDARGCYCRNCRRLQYQKAKAYWAAYRQRNADKIAQYQREYRSINSDKIARGKRCSRLANIDRERERRRMRYRENRERELATMAVYYREHREQLRKYYREWKEQNPDKRRASHHKRRAMKKRSGGSFTAAEWQDLCARYGDRCACCGDPDKSLTVDHVVPVTKGGRNDIGNIQPLCMDCNGRKGSNATDYR